MNTSDFYSSYYSMYTSLYYFTDISGDTLQPFKGGIINSKISNIFGSLLVV